MIIEQNISNLVYNQFPDFFREEGQTFLQFVKAYYEYLEEEGNFINKSRNLLEYNDIDETLDSFLTHFQQKYMAAMPKKLLGNKRFLQKHILDIYRSKGSIEGLKLLFILLYNEEIEVYIPSYDILKASDGRWIEPKFIEVKFNENNASYQGKEITGAVSGATAVVDRYEKRILSNKIAYVMYITDIKGDFVDSEFLLIDGLAESSSAKMIGSIRTITVTSSKPGFELGEFVKLSNEHANGGFIGRVSEITSKAGIINFTLIDGGSGYSLNAVANVYQGSNTTGSGAAFVVDAITNTSTFEYSNDLLEGYGNVSLNATTYAANGSDVSNFASANSGNVINDVLSYSNVTVGTISRIRTTNPGSDYNGDPQVQIIDPYTSSSGEVDANGAFIGRNANVTAIAESGDGVVSKIEVVGSGFGIDGSTFTFESIANSTLTGTATLTSTGYGLEEGFWEDTESFTSSNKYLHDSYYYQEYSYEIHSSKSLDVYKDILRKVYHPSGNEMFGSPLHTNEVTEGFSMEYSQSNTSGLHGSNTATGDILDAVADELNGLVIDFANDKILVRDYDTIDNEKYEDVFDDSFLTRSGTASRAVVRKSNGFWGYSPHNLMHDSHNFANTSIWLKIGLMLEETNTISTEAPDGTTTACILSDTDDENLINRSLIYRPTVEANKIYCFSVYAKKKGTMDGLGMFIAEGTGVPDADESYQVNFDLENGTCALEFPDQLHYLKYHGIEDVGNGWYRCNMAIRVDTAATINFLLYPAFTSDFARARVSTPGEGPYLWGFQFEENSEPTEFVSTLGGIGPQYGHIIEYDANIEVTQPGANNIIKYSHDFSTTWTSSANAILTANTGDAPANSTNASTLFTGEGQTSLNWITVVHDENKEYIFSVYAKAGTSDHIVLRTAGIDNSPESQIFDLSGGTANGVHSTDNTPDGYGIEDAGDGWYRCWIMYSTSSDTSGTAYIYHHNGTDFNVAANSNIEISGAQLERAALANTVGVLANTSGAFEESSYIYSSNSSAIQGLLIQEERTNLSEYSIDPEEAYSYNFSANGITDCESFFEGTKAKRMYNVLGQSSRVIETRVNMEIDEVYVASTIIEKGDAPSIGFGNFNSSDWLNLAKYYWANNTFVDLAPASARYQFEDLSIEDFGIGPNGGELKRFKMAFRIAKAGLNRIYLYPNDVSSTNYHSYLHHFQIEKGLNATSPIINEYGSSTRTAVKYSFNTSEIQWDDNEGYWEIVGDMYYDPNVVLQIPPFSYMNSTGIANGYNSEFTLKTSWNSSNAWHLFNSTSTNGISLSSEELPALSNTTFDLSDYSSLVDGQIGLNGRIKYIKHIPDYREE